MSLSHIGSLLSQAQNMVVLTGAGVSRESGIPTFRDALEGHWARFDPGELATPQAFAKNPELVTRWYDERRQAALACAPNPGHHALAAMEAVVEKRGGTLTILTQNVDAFHQLAGSQRVIELHGSLLTWRCSMTGKKRSDLPVPFPEYPPPTPDGGFWRPDVVWFGEALPADALEAAGRAMETCDLYLAIGTSGVVWPAAGYIGGAQKRGAPTIEINPMKTILTSEFDHHIEGPSGVLLPELLSLMTT